MKQRNFSIPALIALLLIPPFGGRLALGQDRVFWTDSGAGRIERANLDGSNRVTLVSGITPVGIAVDAQAGMMYWTERFPARIRRADLDGLDVANLVTRDLVDPDDIELDTIHGKNART